MYRSFGKRIVDLTLAFVGLIVLSPVMAALAAIIKIEDHGPALFKQPRVGKNGSEFTFLKFRSMPVETPHVESANAESLQITRVGRIVRRTSLDELPQLVNVLIGDMSLVGPRPPLASQEELIQLRQLNGSLALRPGLTGLAQINGYDGMPNSEKGKWDGRYARAITFRTDARIVARTLVYLVKTPPTY
jgi:O-antigen biosynthesis protein WbqP